MAAPASVDSRGDGFQWTTDGDPNLEHIRHIATGGYGEVHEIKNKRLGKVFARKLVRYPNGRRDADAEMELTTLIALCRSDTAENVVQVIDHGWLSRHTDMYYDMELCDANLYNYLSADWDEDQKKKMPWFTDVNELGKLARGLQIWNIMIDISAGINFIHSKRFIHRDIKPRNVLYSCHGKCWKIADFGLTVPGSANTGFVTQRVRGSEGYRAPELLKREKSEGTNKVDIFATGIVLYELIHQRKPFEDDRDVHDYYAGLLDKPVSIPIDASTVFTDEKSKTFLSKIIHQMLSEAPPDRPTAQDLHKSFKIIIGELLNEALGTSSLERLCPREHGVMLIPANPDDDDLTGRTRNSTRNQANVVDPSVITTLEENLETRIKVLGAGDASTLQSMRVLGDNYLALGMKEKGLAMFRRRLEAGRDAYKLGRENPTLILLKNDLALAYANAREFEEAVKIGEEINEALPRAFAPEDTNFLTMRYNLAYYYEFSGRLKEAVALYEEVLAACRATNDYEHRVFLITLVGLESLYVRVGRANDSMKICQEIVDVYEKLRGESDTATLVYMKLLAKHYLDRGRPRINDAISVYARIVRIRKGSKGAEDSDTLAAMSDLANAYRTAGQREEAKKVLRETLEIRKRVLGETHRDTLQNMDDLALIDVNQSLLTRLGY